MQNTFLNSDVSWGGCFFCVLISVDARKTMKKLMRDAWHLLVLALKALQIPWEKPPFWYQGKKETWTNLQLFQKLPVEWSTRAARHLNQPLTIEAWNMTNTYPDGSQCIIRLKTHGWSRWWTHRGTHLVDCDAHRIMKQIDFPLTICDTFYSNNLKLQWNLTSNQILKVFLI